MTVIHCLWRENQQQTLRDHVFNCIFSIKTRVRIEILAFRFNFKRFNSNHEFFSRHFRTFATSDTYVLAKLLIYSIRPYSELSLNNSVINRQLLKHLSETPVQIFSSSSSSCRCKSANDKPSVSFRFLHKTNSRPYDPFSYARRHCSSQ